MKTKEEKFTGMKLPGIPTIIAFGLILCALIALLIWMIGANLGGATTAAFVILDIIVLVILLFSTKGFLQIFPNTSCVMIFFGKYEGTIKENGYFWVNPFYVRNRLSFRAKNLDPEPIKVNDKAGNPVMIGQVVVWRIVDTYKASFNIDNTSQTFANFVKVQSDSALRYVTGMYAYDNNSENEEEVTLRSGGEGINDILEKQLNERLAIAGIEVIEARVNYLAYAPEIAAVMLRRQQADAIISAREKIVDGAVGMVKLALDKLADENILELDDDKKAAMVTNLLVVLCSDEPAQPIINSGTLYN
jgi:regulator of protease activity HflC (stomatin/prohibitin superfamily)